MNGSLEHGSKSSKSSPRRLRKKLSLQDDFFSHAEEPRSKKKKTKSPVQDRINELKRTTALEPSVETVDSDDSISGSLQAVSTNSRSIDGKKDVHIASDSGLETVDDENNSNAAKEKSKEANQEASTNNDNEHDAPESADDSLWEVSSEESDIEQFLRSTSMDTSDKEGYDFAYKKEKKRKYIIHVKSKLLIPPSAPPGSVTEAKFLVNGSKMFDRILELMILHFNNMYLLADSNERLRVELSLLVWVNGRMEIKPFFKPSTLRIPLPSNVLDFEDPLKFPVTEFQCLLIPVEHSKDYLQFYPEFNNGLIYRQDDDIDDDLGLVNSNFKKPSDTNDYSMEDVDDDLEILEVVDEGHKEPHNEEVPDVFVIGLKGSDNKRIECQVSKSTPFRHILDHFVKVKQLQNVNYSAVKMIFDDEQIDLDTLVGDTELEEDFEVQIVL